MFGMTVITNAGAALVRQALSLQKKIVFTRSCYGSQWDDSRADLANKPIEWYDVGIGTILGVSAGSQGLRVVAQHALELIPVNLNPNPKDPQPVISEEPVEIDAPKPVKAVCICAQLKKDGANPEYDPQDDVIFAATCNDNSCFTWADPFTVDFDLPIPMSAVVDDTGSTSGDYVTLDTDQTITGVKTFGVFGNDDWHERTEIGHDGLGVVNNDSGEDNPDAIVLGSVNLLCRAEGDENYRSFAWANAPLNLVYNVSSKTVDLTLGDGTKIRLTCTNVEENPA